MTDPQAVTTPPSPKPGGPRSRPSLFRLVLHALFILSLVALAVLGWRRWKQGPAPEPPAIPLEGVDSDAVEVIQREQDRVRQQPRSAEAWARLGKVLLAHGFPLQAAECFARAQGLDPNDPRWPYLGGMALLRDDGAAGQRLVRQAVDLAEREDPANVVPRLQLAELLLAADELAEAAEQLDRVAQSDPDGERLRFLRGLLAFRRGRWQECVDLLTPLADHPSARQKASATLANAYRRLNQPDQVEKYRRLVTKVDVDEPWEDPYMDEAVRLAVSKQARLMGSSDVGVDDPGHLSDSLGELRKLAQAPDASPVAHVAYGNRLMRLNRFQQAERALRKGLTRYPNHFRLTYSLAASLYYQGRQVEKASGDPDSAKGLYREALTAADRAVSLKPNDAVALLLQGRLLLLLGKRDEAVRTLRKAITYRMDLPDPQLILGQALMEQGRYAEARKHLERAALLAEKDDPKPAEALRRLDELEKKAKGGAKPPAN